MVDAPQASESTGDRLPGAVPGRWVVAVGLLVLAACVWLVHQGGLWPAEPGATATLAGVVLIALQSLPLLLAWWIGAAGLGGVFRQRGVAQLGVGMAALLVLNYVVGYVAGFDAWTGWVVCGAGGVAFATQRYKHRLAAKGNGKQTTGGLRLSWWWLLALPGVAMLVVAACCPPGTMWRIEALGYDVTSYHLQIPREWVAAGGMVELEHNVYAYLPGLMEAAYATLITMRGGEAIGSVYVCQLFHGSFALLAAAAVASTLRNVVQDRAAAVGGAVVVLLPWTVVTGSLAYNEQVAVSFAAVGLSLLTARSVPCGRVAVAVGLLAGAATLAKLTAAFTVALPLGGVLLWRLVISNDVAWGKKAARVGLCVVVGAAVLLPYLGRNAAWTGNPAFPFAGSVLGHGHWDQARAERWDAAHMPEESLGQRLNSVWRQAIGNTGYGAVGGQPTPAESRNIARFEHEGGLPVLWLVAAGGVVFGLLRPRLRWFAAVVLVFTLGQFVWWLAMTHLQSRFLILCVLPLALGAGLAIEAVSKLPGRAGVTGPNLAGLVLGVTLATVTLTTTWSQTTQLTLEDGQRFAAPLWLLTDGLPEPHGTGMLADLPLNALPADSKVMIVGNNQALFYMQPDIVYASAFDESPLTSMVRASPDDSQAVASALRRRGVTHLWVGYSELDRLHATYGFDAEVTTQSVSRLIADWPHLSPPGPTVLVEVPGETGAKNP